MEINTRRAAGEAGADLVCFPFRQNTELTRPQDNYKRTYNIHISYVRTASTAQNNIHTTEEHTLTEACYYSRLIHPILGCRLPVQATAHSEVLFVHRQTTVRLEPSTSAVIISS